MGRINIDIVSFFQNKYPEVTLTEDSCYYYARGRFIIYARYQNIELDIAPKLLLTIPKDYPNNFPLVYDLDNKIINEHRLSDGALCVATEFDLLLELYDSKSLTDYFDKFLIPYFISYKNWLKTGKYIFGDRSHGISGIYESLGQYFHVDSNDRIFIEKLLLWTIKVIQFYKIYTVKIRQKMQLMYSSKIAKLRKVGILNLRKVYKNLTTLHEYEKHYYQYKQRLKEQEEQRPVVSSILKYSMVFTGF